MTDDEIVDWLDRERAEALDADGSPSGPEVDRLAEGIENG